MNISEDNVHLRWVRNTCYIERQHKKIMSSCTSFYLEQEQKGWLKYFDFIWFAFLFQFSQKTLQNYYFDPSNLNHRAEGHDFNIQHDFLICCTVEMSRLREPCIEELWGAGGGKAGHDLAIWNHTTESQNCPGMHQKGCDQQVKGQGTQFSPSLH